MNGATPGGDTKTISARAILCYWKDGRMDDDYMERMLAGIQSDIEEMEANWSEYYNTPYGSILTETLNDLH